MIFIHLNWSERLKTTGKKKRENNIHFDRNDYFKVFNNSTINQMLSLTNTYIFETVTRPQKTSELVLLLPYFLPEECR